MLRALLRRTTPVLLAGAHNGLSARLVEFAGFDAVWASGFEISAASGLPDADILTRADYLWAARAMEDATCLPVLADCDAGFGNPINAMRTVREYEKAGIAGICIEDNAFPKRCSFYDSATRSLESTYEFSAKVRAAKRAQDDPDFVIVARTEALIVGLGVTEALSRARAYADAGADLCLIHSKATTADEVVEVAHHWDRPQPLVCVPTMYADTPAGVLHAAGYKVIIYANQGLRGAITGMRQALATIRRELRAGAANETIASMEDVYSLVGVPALRQAEAEFLAGGTDPDARKRNG